VNLLYTVAGGLASSIIERNLAVRRRQHHIVEFVDELDVEPYLRCHRTSSLALIDAIVCSADGLPRYELADGGLRENHCLERAMCLSWDARTLPENCAMRDGRKWRSIPFVIFRSVSDYEMAPYAQRETHAHIELAHGHPTVMMRVVAQIVDQYQKKVLDDYEVRGIMVRLNRGRAQIGPALKKKAPEIASEFYYAPADRRNHSRWVTVMRDQQGLPADIQLFGQLINSNASEREMHRFFEEHPAFLMQARLGVPISHSPVLREPKGWTPDYSISSILGPINNELELLELKGPRENFLTSGVHGGFSAKVKVAIDQVRDYERSIAQPANHEAVLNALGYTPKRPRLAVLIGRAPSTVAGKNIRARRQSEVDVQVITYDEILAIQEDQTGFL
jgi:hypothetical protein